MHVAQTHAEVERGYSMGEAHVQQHFPAEIMMTLHLQRVENQQKFIWPEILDPKSILLNESLIIKVLQIIKKIMNQI